MRTTTALEKHYRVSELAELWGFCPGTVIKLFSDEPGVLKLQGPGKTTLSIPESVALRVHERLTHDALQTRLPGGNPRRVVRLRDLHVGVPKKPRKILKLKSGQQLPKRACLPQPVGPAVSDPTPDL